MRPVATLERLIGNNPNIEYACIVLGVCEDEFHFTIKCPLYDKYRKELCTVVTDRFLLFTDYSDSEQFIWLMLSLGTEIIRAVCC